MPLVEVFTPTGALEEEQRAEISRQLMAEMISMEGVPDTPAVRSISWVLWRDIDDWWVGADKVSASDPRYVVRVQTPEGSLEGSKRGEIVERVTAVIAKAEPDPDRLMRETALWVIIDEVPEGNWGSHGRVIGWSDIRAFLGIDS